jgi:uncharacterized protein (UPF0128 family)
VVAEATRVDGKELGKKSKSIASEGLEGHCEKGNREAERRREGGKMKRWGMRLNVIEGMRTYLQSNVERERNPMIVVAWREGKTIRQKGRL